MNDTNNLRSITYAIFGDVNFLVVSDLEEVFESIPNVNSSNSLINTGILKALADVTQVWYSKI
jgi:hypothetical protein